MPTDSRQGELFEAADALPGGLVYSADFISAEEEAALLTEIARLPLEEARYKEYTAKRRIVSYGSQYDFGDNRLLPGPPVPPFLRPLREKAARWCGLPAADLVTALVAEYTPGTALGWHRDVPDFEVVVGVSLGTAARMRFRPYPPTRGARVYTLELAPRSAYVLRGEIRWRWQHAIAPTPGLRYSITFRTLRASSGP